MSDPVPISTADSGVRTGPSPARSEERTGTAEEELGSRQERLEQIVAERTRELARSQQFLDETSRLSRVGGWEYDLRSNELAWTDVTYEIHEADRSFHPTVEAGIAFYAPESRPRISEVFGRAVSNGEPFDEELELITARGNRIWVRAIGHPYLEDGKTVRVSGVFQDIQARKLVDGDLKRYRDHLEELVAERTAEALRTEAELLEAQSVGQVGSWTWDARGDRLSGSGEFYRLFAVPPERIGSLSQFLELLHPDDRAAVERAVAAAIEGDGTYRAGYRVARPDGGWRHLEARGFVAFDEGRHPIRMVGTCLDITELKEAELSLERANERLRRDEDLLNETGRLARIGGWEIDLATNSLRWTEETRRIHEVGPDFEPTVEKAIGFYHPDDRAIIAEAVRKTIEEGQPFDVKLRIITARGREVLVEALGRVFVRDGVAVRLAGALQDVTQRTQADDALRKSEERLRRIAATVPGMLYEYVLDDAGNGPAGYGRFLYVTPGCQELLELEPRNLLSDIGLFWRMVHPDDAERFRRENVEAVRDGVSFVSECRVVTPSGRTKWLHFKSRPNPTTPAEPGIWSGVILDVTDRRRAEEEREASSRLVASQRELFETMLRSLPIGVILFRGADYVVETLNPAYQAMAPGKEMLGRRLEEIWPEAIAALRPIYDTVRETGIPFEVFDAPFALQRAKDGPFEPCWFSWTLVRTRLPGSDEWGVLASTIETTEQVKARQAVELLEERLLLAQEASGSGTWDWDFDSGQLAWSPEFFRLFGLDAKTQSPTFETWRATLHPEDRESAEENIATSVRDHVPLVQSYRVVRPGGAVRWIEARGNASYDAAGGPKRMSGLCFDVTERVTIENELKSHREHLEELVAARTADLEAANHELESFSYSVSHDLRAPLRAIDGFVGALVEGYPDRLDEKGRHYLDRIQVATRRMGQLINEILDLSRLSRRELKVTNVDLTALAREVVAELSAAEPGRTLDVSVADGMSAAADPVLLRSVFENLVGNAFKFTSRRPEARVEIGRMHQPAETVFFVRDNGVGFDMQWAEKLFTPFQRLHGPAEFPGTGIGLATVHRIVTRHGGRIWPESSLDGGATFYFTIGRGHA
ncbi:MAG: PAS domain-containing protein [Holophagales bacterium]|nr:PAS domain-containing protein [Holophagales bacterium]